MRQVVLAAIAACFAMPVGSQDPFLTGDALREQVQKNCAEGCLVLNGDEFRALVQNVNQLVQEREAAAFKRGSLSCRNAI
jgi:hypothetical protein